MTSGHTKIITILPNPNITVMVSVINRMQGSESVSFLAHCTSGHGSD